VSFIVVKIEDGFNEMIKKQAWMTLQQQIYETIMCCKHTKEFINSSVIFTRAITT